MKRLFYKLAFWFVTLSWAGGNRGCETSLYGPECYHNSDCGKNQVCWDRECRDSCETDEDCLGTYFDKDESNYDINPSWSDYDADPFWSDSIQGYANPGINLCDPKLKLCKPIGCYTDKHCNEGYECTYHQCIKVCEQDSDCPELYVCDTLLSKTSVSCRSPT